MKLLRAINRQPILLIISQLLQQNKHTFSLQVNVHFCSTSWAESVQTNRRTRPLSSWVRQWIQIGGADIADGLAAVPKSETQTPSVNNYYHDIDCCNHLDILLTVHLSIIYSLFPTWYTAFLSTYNICYPLSSTCCRPRRPIIRRSKLYMQPMVFSPSADVFVVQPFSTAARQRHLQRGRIP
jgi:hypothetical protein